MESEADLAERTCIVTRQCRDEEDLIRFVRSPGGVAVPDIARNLPGRGAWVSLNRSLVAEAQARKLFARSFGAATEAPGDLADQVGELLRKAALSYLSLARKAGQAIAGFAKVEEMLRRGEAEILIHAAEAQPDGCRKLDRLAGPNTTVSRMLRGDELDLAFGRANVIHAAVAPGGLSQKLRQGLRRIEIYETQQGLKGTVAEA